MNSLRQSFFEAVKQASKIPVSKSAQIISLKNEAGQIVGYTTAEVLSPEERARVTKQPVSKSAPNENPADTNQNEIFDSLWPFLQPSGQTEVQKSVEDDSQTDESFFPPCMRTKYE